MMRLFWQWTVLCTIVLWADAALSQRRPIADDTLGEERSIVTPEDNIRRLPGDRIEGGARRGDNLFHSFREFNIDTGRAVYFDDPGVQNILSRVTGGTASDIFGRLGVLGNANLFLINPSGIIFGPGARLDVNGSFVASTADSFVFENGFAFSATNPQAPPLLTMSVPIGLQYGIQSLGAITVNRAGLFVNSGQSLILAGGAITLNNGGLGVRYPQGGRIELGAVSGAGTVGLEQNNNSLSLSIPETLARTNVKLDSGVIDAVAENGGNIAITAQNLDVLNQSFIQAGIGREGTVNSQAGDIVLDATDAITIGQTSLIANNVFSNAIGNAGNLRITAGTLTVARSQLQAITLGRGDAGDVIIDVRDLVVFDNGAALSRVESTGSGRGGNVEITTGSLEVINGAQLSASTSRQGDAGDVIANVRDRALFDDSSVFSSVERTGIGRGGNIEITAGSLEVINGAQLIASTEGRGDAGSVIINVRDRVLFDGTDVDRFVSGASSRVERTGIGRGGNIEITAGSLEAINGAQLIASTLGRGDAGDVIINVRDRVLFDGTPADGFVSGAFSRVESTDISRGGNIEITAGSLEVINGAQLSASTLGRGDAGDVIINVRDRVLFDGTNADRFVSGASSRVESTGSGRGGNIEITAGSLEVINGAQLITSTLGQGDAGDVIINARDTVSFEGVGRGGFSSGLFTFTSPGVQGQGGGITIDANSVRLTNGAVINAQTFNRFQGGDVVINADTFDATDGGRVITTTAGSGRAGNITLNTTDRITLSGFAPNYDDRLSEFGNRVSNQGAASGLFANTTPNSSGRGGTIRITTGELDISNRARIVANTQGSGEAGNIRIDSDLFEINNNARLLANTEGEGDAGNVIINADTFDARNGGRVITTTADGGRAGNITLNTTDRITLSNNDRGRTSGLFANTAADSSGRGGSIRVRTGELNIFDRAEIVASSQGSGIAGDIDVMAQSIELDRGRLTAETNTVEGGNIAITTDSLSLTDNAQISVNSVTENEGGAGDIEVQARNIELDGASEITAETASGQGGNISLNNAELLLLRNSSRVSTTAGTDQAEGDGGNINIDADFIVAFPNEDSDIRANAFTGSGGNIDITTEGLFGIEERDPPTSLSDITASSELGVQGTININTPDVDPSRGLAELPADIVDASDRIAQTCPTDGNAEELGEFVVTGRGGLPPNPAELLGGETVLTELAEVEDGEDGEMRGEIDRPSTTIPPQAELVEAQGWVVGADGKVVLTADNLAVEPHSPSMMPVYCERS